MRCPSFKGGTAKLGINLVCCAPASRKQGEIIVIHNCDIVRLNAFFSVENLLGSTQDFTDGHPERSGGPGLVNRSGKSTRVLTFRITEVLVTRRESNTITIAHNLYALNAHGDIKIADKSSDNSELLSILLTKKRDLWADQVQGLRDNQGDTRKVRRTRCAFKDVRDRTSVNTSGCGNRISIVIRGSPNDISTHCRQGLHIRIQSARIGIIVFSRRELRGVDEDRDNDVISEFVGLPNEFQMASVQRSHSHDERHAAFKGTKSRC